MNDYRKESADLALKDAAILEDLAGWLRSYHFEVDACGRDGCLEMEKVNDLARQSVKALANYL